MNVQIFRSGGQSDSNSECLVPKKAWFSFIDPLKVESTLPISGFEPKTCGVEAQDASPQPLWLRCLYNCPQILKTPPQSPNLSPEHIL
ncbi:hypothetical protein TNCV_4573041 [Trichonephila clavipes]|nr:hypothetical protein TNCV_4573041 [Trichonephila clavipes]